MHRDVAEYCQRCPECQRIAKGGQLRVLLITLPVMKEPFERIAMDIVGPLPRSRRGNQYILVVCDYATRYLEAIPIPQSTTGFSPFELLYGREVRGPLDVLREEWEVNKKSDESVFSHILLVRERLEEMSELVSENLKGAQKHQKLWYD